MWVCMILVAMGIAAAEDHEGEGGAEPEVDEQLEEWVWPTEPWAELSATERWTAMAALRQREVPPLPAGVVLSDRERANWDRLGRQRATMGWLVGAGLGASVASVVVLGAIADDCVFNLEDVGCQVAAYGSTLLFWTALPTAVGAGISRSTMRRDRRRLLEDAVARSALSEVRLRPRLSSDGGGVALSGRF